MAKTDGRYYALVVFAWLIYIGLYLTAPMTSNTYNLSLLKLDLLKLTIGLLLLAVWLFAVYGALSLQRYAKLIQGGTDGRGFRDLANGFAVLASGLIITSLTGQILPYALRGGWIRGIVIFNNYLQILLPLLAFYLTFIGSRRLLLMTKSNSSLIHDIWLFLTFAALSPLYTWLVLHNPDRLAAATPGVQHASHYLSDPLILTTIIMPYLVVWGLGAMTVINLKLYGAHVAGPIYRQALKHLANGCVIVILFSIMLQLLTALSSTLTHLGFSSILAVVYALIIVYAAGYGYIARGSRSLSKIEEVQ